MVPPARAGAGSRADGAEYPRRFRPGHPCEQLSADWVAQRSKGLSIWSLVENAVTRPKDKVVTLIEQFMYPRDGYVRIPERMAEDIVSHGNVVRLNSAVSRIVYHGPNDFEVFCRTGEEEHGYRVDAVVSTIPLGVLARAPP